jgi:hypothetical protein
MKQDYPTTSGFTFRLQPFGATTALFLLFFLLIFFNGFGQNPETIIPEYEWEDEVNLPGIGLTNPSTEDITVATDTDSAGNIYTLTFGNGVKKRNPEGGSPQNFIPGNQFESPLDLAIDNQGNIYVADYFAQDDGEDNGKVKVYNSDGSYIRTIFTGFYRPVGLAIDNDDNIYVAEYNDANQGPEQDQVLSRLSIYDSVGGPIDRTDENLDAPYRLAVDSNKRVFVSQAGDDNPKVLIFNSDLDYQGTMPGVDSPGSIVVDKFDFIHIIEYSGRVDFKEFLTISTAGDAIAIAGDIYEGIEDEVFYIKVFNQSLNPVGTVRDYLEFPIDVAFNDCTNMIVLNSDVEGIDAGSFGFLPTNLYFSLEIFNRTPSLDTEDPIAICIPAGEEFQLQNGKVILTPEDIDDGSTDNCGIDTMELARYEFTTTGPHTVSLIVTDEAGNTSECSTTIEILPEEQAYNFQCIGELTVNLGEEAQNSSVTEIPTSEFITSDISNLDLELINQQFTCEDIGTNPLTIRATNSETGEEFSCVVNVTVEDVGAPLIICLAEPITINLPDDGYEVPDFFENRVSDNCNSREELQLVQDIEAGTIINTPGTYTINLTATDTYDNVETCEIKVILEENNPTAPEIECIYHKIFLDENGQAILDPNSVYNGERDDLELSISPENFDCSNLGENTVILTATDPETNLSSTCTAQVEVFDEIDPIAKCVEPGRQFQLQNGSVTISPSAIDLNSADNCEITRRLSQDTFTTPGRKDIILYVEDAAGKTDQCSTSIEILAEDEEPAAPVYRCIEEEDIPNIRLDENCELQIPDYTRLIETENFTPVFTQTYEQLTEETLYFTIEIKDAETGELVGDCKFSARIVDLIPPSITCTGNQVENFDPDTGFEVPNYESLANYSDNCGEATFQQRPEAGEIIYENTTVTLTVFDARGLGATCSFELQLSDSNVLNIFCQIDQNVTLEEDCSFTLPDYRDTATVSFPSANITQTPPEGTVITENTQIKLTASLNGETDDCYFMVNLVDSENPEANCVSGFVVNLDANGNASIAPEALDNNSTDNCGIVSMALSQADFTRADLGEVPITLTVRDNAGNMDSCETTVEVVDSASGAFECRENIVLNLDENAEASLNLQDLYTGNASGLTLEASRLNFNCTDLGVEEIQLDYSGDQTGSCTINVEVRDEIPPVINTDIVELTLDIEGFAYLEENAVLANDNCSEELIYRFSKSVFTCKDVGTNTVNVEVEDASGNIRKKNIEIRVNGEACEIPEGDDIEFLFLYPNPNNGIFTIATPEGIIIERIRVFDSRGRYILEQDYNANARFYRMTIQGVEESVYTLQIFTNEGVIVKRAIIKR